MRRGGPNAVTRARALRRDQTDVERTLWLALRDRRFGSVKFRRQVQVGGYIVDFACPAKRLVIELDGGQHSANRHRDELRTQALNARGYRVIRFWNSEVTGNLDGVLVAIRSALDEQSPSPNPLPLKGERASEER